MNNINRSDILKVVNTSTFRQTAATFIFTVVNGLLGMIFYIFSARYLGPSDFGEFTLLIVFLALVTDIGNLGINSGIVNFVSKYIKSDSAKAWKYLKLALCSKLTISIIIIILGYLVSPFLAEVIFNKPQLTVSFRISFLGIVASWLFSFSTSHLQATQKFIGWGLIQIFSNSFRLIMIIYFYTSDKLNINSALVCYTFPLLAGFIISFIGSSLKFIREKIDKNIYSEFFNFNKWVAVSGGISALSSRTDTFILGRIASTYDLGLYSAANQLVQVVPQIISAIGTVVAPKFASYNDNKKMFSYLKKLQFMVTGIAGVLLISTPIVKPIINSFYGSEYENSYKIFVILVIGMSVFLLSIPIHNAIIYYYQYPRLFSYLSVLNLLIVGISAYYLTKYFGVSGTAYAVLLGNLVNLIVPLLWFIKRIKY